MFVALVVVVVVVSVAGVTVVVAATTQFISACTFETMNFTLVANGFCCKQAARALHVCVSVSVCVCLRVRLCLTMACLIAFFYAFFGLGQLPRNCRRLSKYAGLNSTRLEHSSCLSTATPCINAFCLLLSTSHPTHTDTRTPILAHTFTMANES